MARTATGARGGQPIYSGVAIETGLALRLVFHQPLRQTEGLLRSIADVLEINIAIPDHTTLSRRGGGLTILPKHIERNEPLHLLVDSTSQYTAKANGSIGSTASGRVGGGGSFISVWMLAHMKCRGGTNTGRHRRITEIPRLLDQIDADVASMIAEISPEARFDFMTFEAAHQSVSSLGKLVSVRIKLLTDQRRVSSPSPPVTLRATT